MEHTGGRISWTIGEVDFVIVTVLQANPVTESYLLPDEQETNVGVGCCCLFPPPLLGEMIRIESVGEIEVFPARSEACTLKYHLPSERVGVV